MKRRRCILVSLPAYILTLALHGCRSTPPAPPTTAPADRIRTDGIYECRGVEVRASTGGWPFLNFGPTTARTAYFLRFYPYGNGETRYMEAREPITTAQAVKRIDDTDMDSGNGQTYLPDSHRLHIVFPRPFPTYADGVIGDGNLILQWSHGAGPEGPQDSYVFRFVKWP